MTPGKNELLDFEKYFKINFRFSYSSNESQVIHKQFPSNIGKRRYNDTCKTAIITKLICSQNSISVIFLMAEFCDFLRIFCHTQKTRVRTT